MDETHAIEVVAPTGDVTADRDLFDAVCAYLAVDEAANTIQLSGFHEAGAFDSDVAVLVSRRGGEIAGVASLEAPFFLLLSHIVRGEAVPALAAEAARQGLTLPGVMGTSATALAFARAWCAATGDTYRPGMAQRILATSMVRHPTGVAGRWRLADDGDNDLLLEWLTDFVVEAKVSSREEAATVAASMLREPEPGSGNLLWLDASEQPVSFARHKWPTPHGVRIGPVYTPPEHRRRGYGGAVTAAATQLMLDQGYDFVCLYTDAANPTSNHIYEEIGYRLVTDSMQYRFTRAGETEDAR